MMGEGRAWGFDFRMNFFWSDSHPVVPESRRQKAESRTNGGREQLLMRGDCLLPTADCLLFLLDELLKLCLIEDLDAQHFRLLEF